MIVGGEAAGKPSRGSNGPLAAWRAAQKSAAPSSTPARCGSYRVFDMNVVEATGGYSGKLLGEVTEPDVLL
jgi:hypothetical protein